MLEHRGYVSPGAIVPGLLLSEMKGSTVESMTTFDSTKESLLDLLQSVKQGKTQLPDFQRGWVWDDDHIRSLLASVSLSFPIGAVMMLQTGNPDVRFKPGNLLVSVPFFNKKGTDTNNPRREHRRVEKKLGWQT